MKCCALFGGGRWARTLLTVLRSVLSPETKICWISKHSYDSAVNWLNANPIANLELRQEVDLGKLRPDAAIVSTSPESHYAITKSTVELEIPTLCEKPLGKDMSQVEELLSLSETNGCPLGINLEFLNASYLHDFADKICHEDVLSVEIDWIDPWVEVRDGVEKYGELYTDIMNDQLPHCWSVLKTIFPSRSGLQITSVFEDSSLVVATGTFDDVNVRCRLSRHGAARLRRVAVNDGEYACDFSQEPGFATLRGKSVCNRWTGDRPLAKSLSEFKSVVTDVRLQQTWSAGIGTCFDAIRSAQYSSVILAALRDEKIAALNLRSEIDPDNTEHVRLIVDRLLPEFAARGIRIPARSHQERQAFVRSLPHFRWAGVNSGDIEGLH
jgi:hypothetical protein